MCCIFILLALYINDIRTTAFLPEVLVFIKNQYPQHLGLNPLSKFMNLFQLAYVKLENSKKV